ALPVGFEDSLLHRVPGRLMTVAQRSEDLCVSITVYAFPTPAETKTVAAEDHGFAHDGLHLWWSVGLLDDAPGGPPVMPGVVAKLIGHVGEWSADRDGDVIVGADRPETGSEITQSYVEGLLVLVSRVVVHDPVAWRRRPVDAVDRKETGPHRQG